MTNYEGEYRSGIIAIVGNTNVGKSTLLNSIVGEKVTIVSNRVQTTRNVIRAILTKEKGQLVFLDTPGIHQAKGDLGKNMNKSARSASKGVDAVLLVVDGSVSPSEIDLGWFKRLANTNVPFLIGINKSDIIKNFNKAYHQMWLDVAKEKESNVKPFWNYFCAKDGKGVDLLINSLFKILPMGPPLFPEDILTDYPRKLNMGDIIREKLFNLLHQEIPHSLAVWVDSISENEANWKIEAFIFVERHSQKGIVIGEKGRLIRKVQRESELELSNIYEKRIDLKLKVKVEKNWRNNFWILKKLGYA